MTVKSKALSGAERPPETVQPATPPSPSQAPTSTDAEEGTVSASRFALYWFGIPILVVLAAVFLRMQCSVPS